MKTKFLSLQRFCLPGLLCLAVIATALPSARAYTPPGRAVIPGAQSGKFLYINPLTLHCSKFDFLPTKSELEERRLWAFNCQYIDQSELNYLRENDLYPSFQDRQPPKSRNANCGWYNMADYVRCKQSCFSGDTTVYFAQQPTDLEQFLNATNQLTSVTTLAENATLSQLHTMERAFELVLPSQYRGTLVQISLRGKTLKVTADHPMVDGQGNIVEAQNFQAGETLLALDGPADIIALQSVDFDGYLWNVAPISQSAKGNVLVINGVFTGGLNYLSADNQVLRIALRQDLVGKLRRP